MKQNVLGAILFITSIVLYYLDLELLQFQWLGFFLGVIAAVGLSLLFGFFRKR
jgi:hypothetical protein